ncbi:MAG: nicotinate-nucleotide adenylyltransferase [Bacteroidaceae bacterium]|nr:nicotinate-nucleotide adenylyltransferase [Bacteroidaceae bacterium]
MKKRIAVYGGSFNPIHIGHLALANYLCEWGEVDEVWFLISPQNPLKIIRDLLPEELRLDLVRAAIADYPRFKASDFEFHLPKPSFTYRTLEALKKEYPDFEFILLMGADNWLIINQWRNYEAIIAENRILIYPRLGYSISESALPSTVRLINAPVFEFSSSAIRQALREGKDLRFFLPPSVYERLKGMQLDK